MIILKKFIIYKLTSLSKTLSKIFFLSSFPTKGDFKTSYNSTLENKKSTTLLNSLYKTSKQSKSSHAWKSAFAYLLDTIYSHLIYKVIN